MASITEEVRKLAADPLLGIASQKQHVERLTEIADRIDAELAERYIAMPLDADGVPIRVGDIVEYVDDTLAPRNVASINLACDGWWVYINGVGRRSDKYRHVTPDTWERIIEEVLQRGHDDYPLNVDIEPYVARCKALCERTKEGNAE